MDGENIDATDKYLRQFNGTHSLNSGWRMIRKENITAITIQTNSNSSADYTVEIRKNNLPAAILTLPVANIVLGQHVTERLTIHKDFIANDFLQCYLNGTSIAYPQVLIEIAWRQ